jgi:hypothetical protein
MSVERPGAAIEIAHLNKIYGNGSAALHALDDINLAKIGQPSLAMRATARLAVHSFIGAGCHAVVPKGTEAGRGRTRPYECRAARRGD